MNKRVCDPCGGDKHKVILFEGETHDLCKPCFKSFKSWLSRDNTTAPGDRVGWRQRCIHFVPCAGPCNSNVWEKV